MFNDEIFFYVYDQNFEFIGLIDKFMSLIWSDRYDEAGDFELVVRFNKKNKELLQKDRICNIEYTDRYATIEKIEITKDDDGNATMTVTGRTLESILDRRIVLKKREFGYEKDPRDENKYLKEYLQPSLVKLFNENIIEPEAVERMIPNFVFKESEDYKITRIELQQTFDKDVFYDIVTDKCSEHHMGFKIILNDNKQLVFSLYRGVDKSDTIIFSHDYGNLNNSEYFSSIEEYKNFMYIVIGEDDEEHDKKEIDIPATNLSYTPFGLERRETSIKWDELKDKKKYTTDEEKPPENPEVAIQRAKKKLNFDFKIKTGFEGEIVPGLLYTYLQDYNVGDRVTLEDEYYNDEVVYISEVVITFDENGLSIIPTFKEIDWEEDEEE